MPETRKPRDWLEVRCASTHRLVGWLTGINAKAMTHEPLALSDPDDTMVIEDEHGVVEHMGFGLELDTMEITQVFENFAPRDMREVYRWCPSYAQREQGAAGTAVYRWIAVSADHEDLETLFDFETFEPWGVEDKALVAAETEFHMTQLLKEAKSLLKGSYRTTLANNAVSGTKAHAVILDEIAEMDSLMSKMPFAAPTPPAPAMRKAGIQFDGLARSLQDLGKTSAPLSEALRKAAQTLARQQDGLSLNAILGRTR